MKRLQRDLMLGLDDIAHNRLLHWNRKTDIFTRVKNYGKRNKELKCYCKELRRKCH